MRTRDAALIRKLCGLGLPPQSLVQSLLPALREIIPAHSGGVFWVDRDAQMTALFAERLLEPEAMASYYERHYSDAAEGFAAAFRRRAESADPVSAHSFSPGEQDRHYFREILRPLDAFHVLYAMLSHHGVTYAQLSLYRGASDAPFDHEDQQALRSLLRYLCEGLYDAGHAPPQTADSLVVEESLGIVSASGEIMSATDQWRRLVRLAALNHVTPSQASRENGAITSFLRDMGRDVATHDAATPAPSILQTPWGRFVIRKFALHGAAGSEPRIGLLIRREEPRALSLIRGAGHSPLSPQQREVALLLADGKSNPEIAQALNLSLNTASYHVKQVYSKLDVNDRGAVQQQLLRLAQCEFQPS